MLCVHEIARPTSLLNLLFFLSPSYSLNFIHVLLDPRNREVRRRDAQGRLLELGVEQADTHDHVRRLDQDKRPVELESIQMRRHVDSSFSSSARLVSSEHN